MNIEKMSLMPLGANCYVVYDDKNQGIVVDPGGEAERVKGFLDDNKIDAKYILLTHGHGDHIGGVEKLRELTGARVGIHEDDVEMLKDSSLSLSSMLGMGELVIEPDFSFIDGEKLQVGDLEIEVIHTPGHTKGGVCFKIGNMLLTGDTLFAGSVGRSDFPGGNQRELIDGIKEKLMVLADDVVVYPGHQGESTIGRERANNPFLV